MRGHAVHPLLPDMAGATPDWDAHNHALTPEFFVEKIERADGTVIDREFVTINVAGDILTACSQPVDDQLPDHRASRRDCSEWSKNCSEWSSVSAT